MGFLFFNVFNGAFRRFARMNRQTQFYAQRCGIGRHGSDIPERQTPVRQGGS